MIIIICIEGKQSNTEINFFEGLSHHISTKLLIFPFEKFKKSSSREKQTIKILKKDVISKLYQEIQSLETQLFFIGDGDEEKDLQAMTATRNAIISYLEIRYKKISITKKILYKKGFSFEKLYEKMLPCKNFPSSSKKWSNKKLFNNFAKKANWFKCSNYSIDLKKIYFDMQNAKNPHIKIIESIIKLENVFLG